MSGLRDRETLDVVRVSTLFLELTTESERSSGGAMSERASQQAAVWAEKLFQAVGNCQEQVEVEGPSQSENKFSLRMDVLSCAFNSIRKMVPGSFATLYSEN